MEARRSANYGVSIWDDDYIQSLTTSFKEEKYVVEAEKLKNEVKIIIDEPSGKLQQLELIDNLQRLGISYYFQDQIANMLHNIWESLINDQHVNEKEKALKFRLLRQHGYHVPQEFLGGLMDEVEKLMKESLLGEDHVRGLVSLHEASYLSMEGESILDLAKEVSSHHLSGRLDQITEAGGLAEQVSRSLELPVQWRVQRLEARWFVQAYESRPDANLTLLKLAKLDYNMVQAKYQDELKRLSSWYKESGLAEKLRFARHRLAECFMWSVGFIPEGELAGFSREMLTKVAVFITIIDDIYDVYGTLEELQLFTDTIQRWDINYLEQLPEYMRICFLGLFNLVNEFAYRIMKDQPGFNAIPHLRRLWIELSRAYYLEAKWFHSGYVPTTEEYLNTAWISISGPLLLNYAYLSTTNPIDKEELQSLEQHYPPIIRCPSMVLRLADDLGTSQDEMKRGDVPKSIHCFMNETGCCEEDARRYVTNLIQATLKSINKHIVMDKDKPFNNLAINLARISLCFYQHGDGFGLPHSQTKTHLLRLLVQHIPMH